MTKPLAALCALCTAVLLGCSDRKATWLGEGTAVPFQYARLLHVEDCDSFRLVTVDNPWKAGTVLHRYVLVPSAAPLPQALPEGTLVRTPLRRSIIFTSVHAALMAELHAEAQVTGVADVKYIKVPFVTEGVSRGTIADCGDGLSPLVEKIIDTQADAILLSPFENSGGYGRLEEVGIPLIECAEYMEASPLARAEWVRLYGMLYGREAEADSLFALVDSSYQALCRQAEAMPERLKALVDKQTGSVWYVPGGRSTIGCMLRDAACRYPWVGDDHSGSLSLPLEAVLERAGDADVWLLRYDAPTPLTMPQLLSEQQGYSQLHAVATGQVYACNVTTSMFYEETPFRPDLLLSDFIKILHPVSPSGGGLEGADAPLRYYHKVE